MMPNVTLRASAGVDGQIHASQSGRTYTIAADGTVTVEAADVRDLIDAGYQALAQAAGPNAEPSNIAAHDPTLPEAAQTGEAHAVEPRQDPPQAA